MLVGAETMSALLVAPRLASVPCIAAYRVSGDGGPDLALPRHTATSLFRIVVTGRQVTEEPRPRKLGERGEDRRP